VWPGAAAGRYGVFDGKLARLAFLEGVEFAIGAKRIAPVWRLRAGPSEKDWADAVGMGGAQVAVSRFPARVGGRRKPRS
jgi:hypothetical protein